MRWSRRVEEQIKKAEANGDLANLKGAGKPLPPRGDGDLADAAGYRIMAEAGAIPEEVRLRKEVEAQMKILGAATDPASQKAAMSKLAELQMRLSIQEEARRRFDRY